MIQKRSNFFPIQTKFQCLNGIEALNVCTNKKCLSPGIVCIDQQCSCQNKHQKCVKANILSVANIVISEKDSSYKEIIQKIMTVVERSITQMRNLKSKISQTFQNKVQLSQNQEKFLQSIKNQNFQQISGNLIWSIQQREEYEKKSLQIHIEKINANVQRILTSLQMEVDKFSRNLVNQMNTKYQNELYSNMKLFFQSKIITNEVQNKNLKSFFKKKILSVKLLYRASQSLFSTDKFWQKSMNHSNTLTICETEFGKKIGGYTPLQWKISQQKFIPDYSGQTFLFSLTNNDKLALVKRQNALYQFESVGPAFGNDCPDFFISNEAYINSSYARITNSYSNTKYVDKGRILFQQFSGGKSQHFRIKQWEVWQIQFQK